MCTGKLHLRQPHIMRCYAVLALILSASLAPANTQAPAPAPAPTGTQQPLFPDGAALVNISQLAAQTNSFQLPFLLGLAALNVSLSDLETPPGLFAYLATLITDPTVLVKLFGGGNPDQAASGASGGVWDSLTKAVSLNEATTQSAHALLYMAGCPFDTVHGPANTDTTVIQGFLRDAVITSATYNLSSPETESTMVLNESSVNNPANPFAPNLTAVTNLQVGPPSLPQPVVAPVQLAVVNTTDTIFTQPHFIGLDHNTSRIVLAIRGSVSSNDWVNDFLAIPAKLQYRNPDTNTTAEGTVHGGFQLTGQNILDVVVPHFAQAAQLNPTYNIHILGHSLGGSLCAYVTFMLATGTVPIPGVDPSRVSGTCFSVPRTFDNNTAALAERYFDSVFVGADMVVRATPPIARASLERAAIVRKLIKENCSEALKPLVSLGSSSNYTLGSGPVCGPIERITGGPQGCQQAADQLAQCVSQQVGFLPPCTSTPPGTPVISPGRTFQLANDAMLSAQGVNDRPSFVTWKYGEAVTAHSIGISVIPALYALSVGSAADVNGTASSNGTVDLGNSSIPGGAAGGGVPGNDTLPSHNTAPPGSLAPILSPSPTQPSGSDSSGPSPPGSTIGNIVNNISYALHGGDLNPLNGASLPQMTLGTTVLMLVIGFAYLLI